MLRLLAMLCLALTAPSSFAALPDTGTDSSLVMDRQRQHFVVNPDGSFVFTLDMTTTIVEPRAVPAASQRAVSYNATLEEIVALEAHTHKPDGRIIKVTKEQIKDQQETSSADAPMFHDTRVKVVVFPDVAVGDKLVLHFVRKRHTPLLPGHFEDLSAADFFVTKQFELIYDMPASMPLYADAVGFETVNIDSAPGRKRYQWRFVDGPNQRMEADSVSYFDYGKRLAVSTFADYPAFATAYHARAGDKAAVTPAIATLARSVTSGLAQPRAKALALSDWVRKNIRYVAVYVGAGGVVPHAASTVLDNRYGDCKDHAVLLEAMLNAVDIASTPALINSGNAYRLPSVPTLGVFNHVITYIPGLDLYLDSTAADVAAGYLLNDELGKPVLLTKTGTIGRTPDAQAIRHHNIATYSVQADGKTGIRVHKTAGGAIAEHFRRIVRDTDQADRDMLVERLLKEMGQQGSGVFDPGNVNGADGDYAFGFKGSSDNFINLPGPTGVRTSINFWGGLGDAAYQLASENKRHQNFSCFGYDVGDETTFEFATGIEILAVPAPFHLEDAYFTYDARYIRKGNSVVVSRALKFHTNKAVCTPADFERFNPTLQRIMRDLKGQIIVRGT
ncbi:DUF3857 domain-containing transglutaminase family protein [Massilia soli]|uniref:DUF3857 domain-containing transglutaminase family protein n=1 Tax=Massilia soli TaxID=2792854 RepID=A0ABS7SIJ0_9BURK|nr:DUF3857 domain-containing transglutaminase family protein [Massilia soli]MBZ2205842.1 DUF3857 domain-containing transglutaminase family protein [Massilia soli]